MTCIRASSVSSRLAEEALKRIAFYGRMKSSCKITQFRKLNLLGVPLKSTYCNAANSVQFVRRELEISRSIQLSYGRKISTDIYCVSRPTEGFWSRAERRLTMQRPLPQAFVTSGNRRIAARLSSVVRCVYWRETAALSCPTISRAMKSETPAAFSMVTALWRKL